MLAKWVLNVSVWMHLTWVYQFWLDSHDLALRFFASTSIFLQFLYFCAVCINKNKMQCYLCTVLQKVVKMGSKVVTLVFVVLFFTQ